MMLNHFWERLREKSKSWWVKVERENPVLYKRKEECCGCTACYAICPKEAISMVEDEEGFEYPKINENKCVRCYQCIKVCPIKAARA